MLCRFTPLELMSQQASLMRSLSASSTFFRIEPWTRRASNMVVESQRRGYRWKKEGRSSRLRLQKLRESRKRDTWQLNHIKIGLRPPFYMFRIRCSQSPSGDCTWFKRQQRQQAVTSEDTEHYDLEAHFDVTPVSCTTPPFSKVVS